IRTAPDGNAAPLRYAAAIEAALREKLGADMGYSGLICKNPLHHNTYHIYRRTRDRTTSKTWRAIYYNNSHNL
ncbi:replication initiation protein, partial [Klebsiella pneumoniae]|uniref:replication initiation protein n=1 Tax=Klebsiella pneumoniae TaxID=573 RepID=UPI00374612DA